MDFETFEVRPHNSHFEGAYSDTELQWLRTCAVDKVRNIRALLAGAPAGRVLEVGCGSGTVLAEVARQKVGERHTGIDVVDPRDHLDSGAAQLELLKYDGDSIPFPDDSFDLVYASHVIEHVPEPRSVLREIRRVASSLIYLEVPCELHSRTSHKALQTTLNIGHINCYTPDSFVILLQTIDLKIKAARLFDHSFDVHRFHSSHLSGTVKGLVRRGLLGMSPRVAAKTFTYHFGVLCAKQ